MFRIYLGWILCSCISFHCVFANTPLQTQLRTAKHDSTRLRLYTELALDYRNKSNIDSLLICTQLGLELAKQLNDTRYCSDLYRHQALYHRSKNQYEQAIKAAQLAVDFGKKNRQNTKVELAGYLLAVIYSDKAYVTGQTKDQITAVQQIYQNISFSYQYHSFTKIEYQYNLLFTIYKNYGNDSLAYFYLKKYLSHTKKSKDFQYKLPFLAGSIDLALYEKSYNMAKRHLNEVLKYKPDNKNVEFYTYVMSDIVAAYIKYKDYNQAFVLIKQIQNDHFLSSNMAAYWQFRFHNDLTTIYLHQKKYKQAQQANEQAKFFLKNARIGNQDHLKILINQQQLFEHQKRFEEALSLNKRINSMQDSLTSARYSFELAVNEERLAFENKDRTFKQQLKIQQLENQRKTERLKNAQQLQWLFALIVSLLLVVVTIIWLQMRRIRKQSEKLNTLNESKNQILAVIGHDLRTPILSMYSSLQRLAQTMSSPQQTKWPSEQLPRLNRLLMTTDNLLYWSQIQQYNKKVVLLSLVLEEVIADVLELLEVSIEEAGIVIHNQVPDTAVVKADQDHLQIILRNIIQNAIKFTPKKGTITLRAHSYSTYVELEIQDSGIGFVKSQETGYKKGTHLGLKLVKELMEANKGSLSIENPDEGGALVRLTFPKG